MAQSTNKKQSNLVDSSSSSAPVPSNTPSSRHTQNEESSMKERHRSDKLVKKTDSKSQSSNEDKSESSSQSKVLKINLPNGQIHSALIRANLTLKDIIEKLCDTRTDLNVDKYHIRDKNGNDLDLSIQLTDLKHSEIDFCHPKDSNLQQEGSLGGRRTPSFVAPLEAIDAATKLDPNLRKRLTEIAQKMRNKQTGVQIKTRKVRLRNFYKCFVASEAVKWLEDNLKISKSEAIALGREMEKEGLIAHVTLSQTFDDSNHLLFRFREDDVVDSLKKSRVEKLNIQGIKRDEDESAVTPKTGTADSAYYYSTFWFASQDPILANKPRPDLQTSMLLQALSSYVPRLVLRRFVRKHSPLICPESEEYPACVLFADISGFTPLAEKLAKLGSRGVEQLTTILNEYFGQIINLIHNHGGDIVKFAGDALLAIWPSVNEQGLLYSVALAAQCAMAMQEYFCEFKVSEEVLTLHVGIGAGMISGIHVGGVGARIEFLIAGEPLNQVSECERLAQPGEVYISRQAAKYIFDRVELSVDIVKDKEIEVKDPKRKEKPKKKIVATLDDGTPCYRLEKVKELLELPPTFLMPVYDSTKDLISAYVQPAVLGHLNSGSTEFLAELRPISVIFVNLGFSYSPGALTKIQEAMCAMQQAVATYEGTVRQFIVDDKGCAFIAAFGLPPLSHEDDPLRAVRTAIMIQKNLKALNISSSIGVTTGKAFCGAIGSEERREYAMVGDIVNLSARLMVKANGNILVDRPTYESSRGAIRFNVLPPVMVKGKTTPVEIFSPVKEAEHRPTTGHNSLRSTIRLVRKRTEGRRNVTINLSNVGRLEKATAPLVGRKNELDQLSKVIDLSNNPSLDDEDARVILVEGEAGIGKTRVLQEVQNMCEEKKVKCIVGFGNTVEQSTPYHAWREVFTVLLNMEDYILLDIPQRQERLSKLLEEYVPEMASCVPLLNAVIPLDIPENEKTAAMAGQLRADNLQVLLLKILQACEFSVIMLENAQWMDSASWGLVLAAAQSMKGVTFILSMRPLEQSVVEFEKLCKLSTLTRMTLPPLSVTEVTLLVQQRLGVKRLPQDIAQQVIERGGGNPLLSLELTDAIRASGRFEITPQGDIVPSRRIQRHESTIFPNNLRALITSKIDRLSQSQQLILKIASVIGRTFSFEILKDIIPSFASKVDTDFLKKDLTALESMDIIALKSEKPLIYLFKQIMTQEVIYAQMLYAQRRQVHEKVAEWLEKHTNANQTFAVLAHHYKQAEKWDMAIQYFSKAGEQALNNFANREAVNFFGECLELQTKKLVSSQSHLTPTPKQPSKESSVPTKIKDSKEGQPKDPKEDPDTWLRIRWHRQLGQAYYNQGLMEKASENLEAALNLMNKPLKPAMSQQLLSKFKSMSTPHIDPKFVKVLTMEPTDLPNLNELSDKKDAKKYRKTLVQFTEANELREYILILLCLARINYYACNKSLVTYCALTALKQAEEMGISRGLCEAYATCIVTLGIHKKHQLAENCMEMGAFFSKQFSSTDRGPLAAVYQYSGMYYSGIANWDKAIEAFKKAIELGNTLGDCRLVEESTYFLCSCYFFLGKIIETEDMLEEAVESARKRGDAQTLVLGLTTMAENQLALGKYEKAMSILQEIESLIGSNQGYRLDMASEINFHGLMAVCHLHKRDFELALKTADTVLALLDQSEPTAYFTFPGFLAPAMVYLVFMREIHRPLRRDDIIAVSKRFTPTKLSQKIGKALSHLAKFADIFPFAEPQLLLWQGEFENLTGKPDKALKLWEKAIAVSAKLKMLYQESLAHFRIGKLTSTLKDNQQIVKEKLEHYDKALDIFSQIGVVYTELLLE